ncbi:hypothetical protein SLS55_001215 [Diplodia seriata]|uniref:Reticulocyte-binding protein 2-like protein a n=1 Tax=Diplodia seriata TaxID=420778 RepID=A0ABR3CXI9_9PEZI
MRLLLLQLSTMMDSPPTQKTRAQNLREVAERLRIKQQERRRESLERINLRRATSAIRRRRVGASYDEQGSHDASASCDAPTNHHMQASYNMPASYHTPASYNAPASYDTPASYNAPASYDTPASYNIPASYEAPASYVLPPNYVQRSHNIHDMPPSYETTAFQDVPTSYALPQKHLGDLREKRLADLPPRQPMDFPPIDPRDLDEMRRKWDLIMRTRKDPITGLPATRKFGSVTSPTDSDEFGKRMVQHFSGMKPFKDARPTPQHLKWWERYRDPEWDPETAHVIPPDQIRHRSPPKTETPVKPSFNWNLAENSNSVILASTPAETPAEITEQDLEEQRLEEEEQRLKEEREQRLKEEEEQRLKEEREQRLKEEEEERLKEEEEERLKEEKEQRLKEEEEEEKRLKKEEEQRLKDKRAKAIIDAMWAKGWIAIGQSPDPEVREAERRKKMMAARVPPEKLRIREKIHGLGIRTAEVDKTPSPDSSTPESPVSPTPSKQPWQSDQEKSQIPTVPDRPQPSNNREEIQKVSSTAIPDAPRQLSNQEEKQKISIPAIPEEPHSASNQEKNQESSSAMPGETQPSSSKEGPRTPPLPPKLQGPFRSPASLSPASLSPASLSPASPLPVFLSPCGIEYSISPRPEGYDEKPRENPDDTREILRALSRRLAKTSSPISDEIPDEPVSRSLRKRGQTTDGTPDQPNEPRRADEGRQQEMLQQRSMNARLDATRKGIRDAYHITRQLLASIDTPEFVGKKCNACEACGHTEQSPILMICTGVKGLFLSRNKHGQTKPTWFGLLSMLLLFWYMMEIGISELFGTTDYASTMDGYGVFPDSPRYPFALLTLLSWIPPFSWLLPLFKANAFHEATKTVQVL